MRHIERNGRGYSFDVMRARMLFGSKAQKRPAYTGSSKVAFMLPDGSGPTYGASVDLLLKELEAENPYPTPEDSEQEEGE